MNEFSPTFYLFDEPSFMTGVARVMDFGLTLTEFNRMPTGEMADTMAAWSDWLAVGEDMAAGLAAFEAEHASVLEKSGNTDE